MNKKSRVFINIINNYCEKNDNFEQTFVTKILRKIFTFFHLALRKKFIILQNMAIKVRIYKKFCYPTKTMR